MISSGGFMQFLQKVIDFFLTNMDWLFSGLLVPIVFYKWMFKNDSSKINNVLVLNNAPTENITTPQNDPTKKHIVEENRIVALVERFLLVYEAHGIEREQLPRFIDQKFCIEYSDLVSNEKLLLKINNELLQWTCDTFGLERSWLDGVSNRIYKSLDFYKNVHGFIDFLYNLTQNYNKRVRVYAFKCTKDLKRDRTFSPEIALLLKVPIGQIDRKDIFKYIPIGTNWHWDYWRTRYQFKVITLICKKLSIYIQGFDLTTEEILGLHNGTVFPERILKNMNPGRTWYPEDYVDLPYENVKVKENDEKDSLYEYIKDQGYLEYFHKVFK